MQKSFYAFLVFLFLNSNLIAQIGGTSVYSFLQTPIAPRVAGAAGAVVANTENDVNFGLWNPALINPEMHGNISLSFAPLSGGVNFGEMAYSHTFKKAGSFLAGVKYVDYGSFQSTNTQAQQLGSFTAADYSFQLGYGYQFDSSFQVGTTLKLINSTYESYNSWALAADFAGVYQIPKSNLAMALILRNVGVQLQSFTGTKEKMPVQVDFGISTRFKHVPLRLNLVLANLQKMDLSYNDPNSVTTDPITGAQVVTEESVANQILRHVVLAAELAPSKKFNLQLGYSFRRSFEMEIPTRRSSAGLTFGIGIKVSKFRINYANTNMNVAGRMHHFGITTWLDDFKKKK